VSADLSRTGARVSMNELALAMGPDALRAPGGPLLADPLTI